MKIATHLLLFNQDDWILKNIEMIAPYVEKIYVAWSAYPWNYNPNARGQFKNKSNPDILNKSQYKNKIELIKGKWDLDEEQRNSCLDAAKKDDMDYLLIIDADEFYSDNDLIKLIKNIEDNPNYDYYTTPWITLWKDYDHILISDNNTLINGYPEVALNIKSGNRFTRCRRPTGSNIKRLDSVCLHASYILTDEQCWSKINTWGHAHQFNKLKWYNEKWKNWNENTKNLHPITPSAWKRAVKRPNNIELPNVLMK